MSSTATVTPAMRQYLDAKRQHRDAIVLFRMGDHNAWVRWFAEAVSGAGRAQQELVASVERLQREWRERLAGYRSAHWRLMAPPARGRRT